MKLRKLILFTCVTFSALTSWANNCNNTAVNCLMPGYNNHGTWAYDSTFSSSGSKDGLKPGLFVNSIASYNTKAQSIHQINQIYAYATDMEMYCKGSGQSTKNTSCTSNLMQEYYDTKFMKGKTPTGPLSVAAYASLTNAGIQVKNIPIIDGRVDIANPGDPNNENDLLDSFNILTPSEAAAYADNISVAICSDDNIDGIQFDIEPFSFTGDKGAYQTGKNTNLPTTGQQYFYQEIAKQFATNPQCRDSKHPQGRVFSVFTYASAITPVVAKTFTQYGNGFIVDSLYDLGPNPGGVATTPTDYAKYVNAEIKAMKTIADQYNLPYKFAVSAAASVHEFEMSGSIPTTYHQVDYLKAVYTALWNNNIYNDPNFKGIDIWGWSNAMWWADVTNPNSVLTQFIPADPSKDLYNEVVPYLQGNL